MAVCDEAGGEAEEGFVDVASSFPADAQAPEAVEPGDGPLHDPAEGAQARAVLSAAFGDRGTDTSLQSSRRHLSWS